MFQAIRQRFTLEVDDARTMVQRTFDTHPSRNFAVGLWDGQEVRWTDPPEFIIGFKDAEVFRHCLATGDPASFAEAYVDGRLSIEGDLWAATRLGSYLRDIDVGLGDKLRFVPKLLVGCAHAFDDGVVNVHQILATKPDAQGRTQAHFTREATTLAVAISAVHE